MAHHAVVERHALAKTLRSAAPESPTLCGEWSVAQLSAHLVLRERSILELSGRLPVRPFRDRAERAISTLVAREPYEQLVDAVDRGPSWTEVVGPVPVAWLWALPPVREQLNLLEYLIHHEDVRRVAPGWAPRPLPVALQTVIWRRLPALSRLAARKLPVGVDFTWPSHGTIRRARQHDVAVTITGDPLELALFAFGRGGHARLELDGPPEAVESVRSAKLGF